MSIAGDSDAQLVEWSLTGDREAFGRIVERYQSLVCSITYGATGSLSLSEDLAQETFVAAWKQLSELREPAKLRAWLCGITRFLIGKELRRQGREPVHAAEPLDAVQEPPAPEPSPSARAISREEEAILWRALERIPDTYRQPLILFYREQQSVERVAEELELSEDAVKQRLSRGRKLLTKEVAAFVEGTLKRTTPGKAFTLGVLAALPAFTISAKAATIGVAAVKGSATAKAAAATGLAGALLTPILGFFGNWVSYRIDMEDAPTEREREHIRSFYRRLVSCIVGFFVVYALLMFWARRMLQAHSLLFAGLIIGLALAYVLAIVAQTIWWFRVRSKFVDEPAEEGMATSPAKPAWEYRSKFNLLGLPFVHIRIGGGLAVQHKPVKAWIAAGDCAIGVLFAFGGMAIAPWSMGGCAIGLAAWGGFAAGLLALGGLGLGVWSFGGLAVGWQAFGGCAVAWNAAVGGVAVARDFALGGITHAAQANNQIAGQAIWSRAFFQDGQIVLRHLAWLNLLWLVPLILWWRTVRKARPEQKAGGA
ncbi:MAG: sigma-70 family RNA polymerase sigma factor [Verrucomicrobiia bacterium]